MILDLVKSLGSRQATYRLCQCYIPAISILVFNFPRNDINFYFSFLHFMLPTLRCITRFNSTTKVSMVRRCNGMAAICATGNLS